MSQGSSEHSFRKMPDVTFSPLSNSEMESGVVTVAFNQLRESVKDTANENESASSDLSGNSSVLTASFNFINSIVGAGIIGIPYAIQRCGFVSGVIMLAYVAYLVYQSVTMLIDCGVKANKLDFEELAEHLLGRSGYYAALVFMFLFAYGAQVAYLVVIGDTIPIVAKLFMPDSVFANRNITIALMSTCIVLPLCLLRDLSSLSWTSMLSIAADIALVLIVLIAAPSASVAEGIRHNEVTFLSSSIFVGIGTMSFAFVCQHNSFIVFRTLKEKTSKNWEKVARGSIFFSFLMCATLGIAGYLCFLEETKGDILNNFPERGVAVSVARLLLAFCMVFTYPMECFVTRHCLLSIVHRIMSDREKAKEKLILSGVGLCGVNNVNSLGYSEEQNPMRRAHTGGNKNNNKNDGSNNDNNNNDNMNNGNNNASNGQRCTDQAELDPRSRHKDGSAYDTDTRPAGSVRRDSLEILLSEPDGLSGDKNDQSDPSVIYFDDVYITHGGREKRNDEDIRRNKILKERRSSGSGNVRSVEKKTLQNDSSNISNHGENSRERGGERGSERSRGSSPETLFTVCGTKGNDSDNDDVTSNDSVSSPCSVSTSITACSAVNEKSEIEEETKSHTQNDGKRKQNSVFSSTNPMKSEMSRDGPRTLTPMQNGEKVHHNEDSNKDTVFIHLNNGFDEQDTEKKNEDKNSKKEKYDFDYDVFHPVSLINTREEEKDAKQEKKTTFRFFSRVCPCCASCPCGLKNAFFSERNNTSRVVVTLLLWGSSVAIALMFRDLGMVLALTGAVAASMLGYVLPGVLYLQTYRVELKAAWTDAIGLDSEDADLSDVNSVQKMNNVIDKKNESKNINNNNNDNNIDNIESNIFNKSNMDLNSSLSSEGSTFGDNNYLLSETKNLVTGRKRKSKYQKFKALFRFFMPFFMILFGCLSMVIGVTSVFLF